MKKPSIEITLGNWGTIRCLNEEHRTYLIMAKGRKDLYDTIQSWDGHWPTPKLEKSYRASLAEVTSECDKLWEAIPNKNDLVKSH